MMIKPFQSGDRVAFFGDSLTHAGSYHRFIRDYYFTRYPRIDLKTFNCGNGGGSAQGALFRMDMDLFNFQPNKVFVMFGMNDVDRYCYGVEKPDAENLRRRKLALESYAEGMEALIRRLLEAKIEEIVLLSPTPYEEEAEMKEMNLKGTCEALIACREINDRLAEKYGCGTVDLFSPMLAANRRLRETDPAASLAGPDRVHPGTPGYAVMAYVILKAQQVPADVFAVTVADGTVSTERCTVSDFRAENGGFRFHLAPSAMPLPSFPELEEVNALVPFTRELNRMPLVVRGLETGNYAVEVDGVPVAEASAPVLAEGIGLQLRSPESEKVGELNRRYGVEDLKLREIMKVEVMLFENRIPLDDKPAIRAYMERFLDEVRDKPWFPYYTNLFRSYFELKQAEEGTKAEMRKIAAELSIAVPPSGWTVAVKRCSGK